jgi:2-furoyl-CoA dehydrogenase FAD binding subunit
LGQAARAAAEADVKPAAFDYVRADTLGEVHAVLAAEGPDARVLAGGQTLLPMLSMRLTRPKVVVDIMRIPALAAITPERGAIRIGAAVRQAELLAHPQLKAWQPLLAAALPWVGHAQTRGRGTMCGSVAHADPSAEIPLVLAALGGAVELTRRLTRRRVAAADFFTGAMSTARADDELVEAVIVPTRNPGEGTAFREFGRRHGDFAIVACAAVAHPDGVRLAIGGVADKPVVRELGPLEGAALDAALDAFAFDLEARDDLHATARYRRELVRQLGRATIGEARACRA